MLMEFPGFPLPCLSPSPRLMNKLQPGSVAKVNRSMQNWHQVRNWWVEQGWGGVTPSDQRVAGGPLTAPLLLPPS